MEIGPDTVLILCAAILSAYVIRRVWRYIWAGLLVFGFYAVFSWFLVPYIGTGQTASYSSAWSGGNLVDRLRNESRIAELILAIAVGN